MTAEERAGLEEEAASAASCLAAVHAYFAAPAPEAAARVSVLWGARRPGRGAFSTEMDGALEHAVHAVRSAHEFEAPESEAAALASEALAAGGADLQAAVRDLAEAAAAERHIARARRNMARTEQIYASARLDLLRQEGVVSALKIEDALRQLSLAADRADLAAGELAELLIQENP